MRIWPATVLVAVLVVTGLAGCAGTGRPSGQPASASPTPSTGAPLDLPSPSPSGVVASPLQPPSVAPNSGTGVTGITLLAGGCPVMREEPCQERPVSVAVSIVDTRTNAVVAGVTSARDGTFRVALPAGRYLVRPATPTGPLMSRAAPVTVDVAAGSYAPVTLRYQAHLQ